MPTIKTIKPAGGGDYTTLAAWWAARKTSGNADEWAECYSGGNLGGVDLGGMTATPDAANYPKIYAAAGNRHDGVSPASGAYIAGVSGQPSLRPNTNYLRIEGLAFDGTGTSGAVGIGASYVEVPGVAEFLQVNDCLIVGHAIGIHVGADNSDSHGMVIRNTVCRSCSGYGINYVFNNADPISVEGDLTLENCTVDATGIGVSVAVYAGDGGTSVVDLTLRNTVAVGANLAFEIYTMGGEGTETLNIAANDNASSDATADDFGGTGNLINQDPDDLFEDPASGDFRPQPNSALIHAGENLVEDFTQDLVGHERPSVGAWDIGALQYVPPYVEYDISYTYDGVGNRLTKVDVHEGTTTYVYDAANQLTSEITPLGTINYTHDLDGNRTQKDDPVHGITNYTYDETNRMLTADPAGGELVSLTYNGADQVVVKQDSSGTRKYVYDGKKLLLETKADDSTELLYDFALTDEYGDLTSRYHDATAGTDYFQFDGLGSTETMSDEAEADVDVYRYKAFGQIAQQFGTEENQFTFVGRQGYAYYPELDLYFAGMSGGGQSAKAGEESNAGRLLDPSTGRFDRPDPLRDDEKNPYPYVRNNPVNVTDPSGLAEPASSALPAFMPYSPQNDIYLRDKNFYSYLFTTPARCMSCHNYLVMGGARYEDLPRNYQLGAAMWMGTDYAPTINRHLAGIHRRAHILANRGVFGAYAAAWDSVKENVFSRLIVGLADALDTDPEKVAGIAAVIGGLLEAGTGVLLFAPTFGLSTYLIADGVSLTAGGIDSATGGELAKSLGLPTIDLVGLEWEYVSTTATGGPEMGELTRAGIPLVFSAASRVGPTPLKFDLPTGITKTPVPSSPNYLYMRPVSPNSAVAIPARMQFGVAWKTVERFRIPSCNGVVYPVTVLQMAAAADEDSESSSAAPGGAPSAPKGSANPAVRKAAGQGSRLHSDKPGHLPDQLRQKYPETEFEFTPSGTAGQDVKVVGGKHPSEYPGSNWPKGVDHGDFKPDSAGGRRTFRSDQQKKWAEPTHQLPYDPNSGDLR